MDGRWCCSPLIPALAAVTVIRAFGDHPCCYFEGTTALFADDTGFAAAAFLASFGGFSLSSAAGQAPLGVAGALEASASAWATRYTATPGLHCRSLAGWSMPSFAATAAAAVQAGNSASDAAADGAE